MKEHQITLKIVARKKVSVRADSSKEAMKFARDILCYTDALKITPEDINLVHVDYEEDLKTAAKCEGCCEDCDSYCEINGTCLNPDEAGTETPCMECEWYCEQCGECTYAEENH